MADELLIRAGFSIPLELVEIRVSRSSGPGGQHANVTASRVEATLDLDAPATRAAVGEYRQARLRAKLGPRVSAIAQDTRSQTRNRELALGRLAAKLAAGVAQAPPRRPSRPTRASVERRLDAKRRQSSRKQDRRPPES